jgi:hypothetical protein
LRFTPSTDGEDTEGFPRRFRCGALAGVALDERPRERPLDAADLPAIALELFGPARGPKAFALMQKPPETVLEGFHWERMPARGGCGRRG